MYRLTLNTGTMHLIMSEKVEQRLIENTRRRPYLPQRLEILRDFHELGRQAGVPATIKIQEEKITLFLYTSSYYLKLYPTNQQDGYSISYVEALGLHQHEQLGKGVLMLRTEYWEMHTHPREITCGNPHDWVHIWHAWQQLEAQRQQHTLQTTQAQEGLSIAHANFLSTVETLVEITHKLEQDAHKLPTLISYRKVEATGEERFVRDIYTFILTGSPQINEKNLLRITEANELQGRVLSRKGNRLTVKFENAIDKSDIPEPGNFEPIVSGAIYRTQKEAIETLRQGEAKNKHLLHALVDHVYQRYARDTAEPTKSLNAAQQEAFQRALSVPDLLLVLGPPGTGKTRTITEIAHQCSLRHQRVLITSRTHKAVDNVLERLPTNLMVIRFGHEDRVAPHIRSMLVDEKTKEMRQHILQKTATNAQKLMQFVQHKHAIEQWQQELRALTAQLHEKEQRFSATNQSQTYAIQRITAPYKSDLDALATTQQRQQAKLTRRRARVATRSEKRRKALEHKQQFLLGLLFQWLASIYSYLITKESAHIDALQTIYTTTMQAYKTLQNTVQQALTNDAEYQHHAARLQSIQNESLPLQTQATACIQGLHSTIQPLTPVSPPASPLSTKIQQEYIQWFQSTHLFFEKRAKLLQDWRQDLDLHTEQLEPELLRYADVVGATCIGVATAKGLTDIEFDLAIVDEAGQISTPDLLVPLVRARRSVLVGDHHQLPPFVESEVQTWLNGLSPQTQQALGLEDEEIDGAQMLAMLSQSTFEQLFNARADPDPTVYFREQRRMPAVIAEFASQHFYNRQLRTLADPVTAHTKQHNALFQSPLVLVNTADLPFDKRKEQQRRASENWDITGFTNNAEAQLIARLADFYEQEEQQEQQEQTWVVIVPYRAQAQRIIQLLQRYPSMQQLKLEERVATVDAFQGGERKNVIYGFTRSNTRDSVGFLKELRRLNVAITRAKQQLILIGDLSTLTHASDEDFRKIASALEKYTSQNGELLSYQQCLNRLPHND